MGNVNTAWAHKQIREVLRFAQDDLRGASIVKVALVPILCRNNAFALADATDHIRTNFMERVWGGRRWKILWQTITCECAHRRSWEIADRPEAQSVVRDGLLRGRTLHELWRKHRTEIFGEMPDAPRFPLLIKLLDAQQNFLWQVHPPTNWRGNRRRS